MPFPTLNGQSVSLIVPAFAVLTLLWPPFAWTVQTGHEAVRRVRLAVYRRRDRREGKR